MPLPGLIMRKKEEIGKLFIYVCVFLLDPYTACIFNIIIKQARRILLQNERE